MTESQDCPCWSKEACRGLPHSTDEHLGPRRGRTRPKFSNGRRAQSATSLTSRTRIKVLSYRLSGCVHLSVMLKMCMCAKSFLWWHSVQLRQANYLSRRVVDETLSRLSKENLNSQTMTEWIKTSSRFFELPLTQWGWGEALRFVMCHTCGIAPAVCRKWCNSGTRKWQQWGQKMFISLF